MTLSLFNGSLRRAVLTVTSAALVTVSAVGVALAVWGQQRTFGEAERLLLDTQSKVVDRLLAARVREMTKLVDAFVRPREIQDALAARDRENLVDYAKPPFNRLSGQGGLTHLAYYDAAGARLAALHGGEAGGAAALVRTALEGKRTVSGIDREAGEPVLTLVQPVYRQGELAGFVQLGMALRKLAPDLAESLSGQGALLVSAPGPRDARAVGGLAMFAPTAAEVPALLAALPAAPPTDRPTVQTVKRGPAAFAVTAHPLKNPAGASEGLLVLVTDVTATVSFMSRSIVWLIGLGAAGLAAALGVTALVLGRRLKPLREIVALLRDIAEGEGDLTRRLGIRSRDEIGELARWFDTFMDKLHAVIGQVKSTTTHVASAAQRLSAASEQLAGGSQEQASGLEETATSLGQLTDTVRHNTDRVRRASELARTSRSTAEDGGRVVTSAVASMAEITRASRRIAEIITVIDEIAFQTNLLALNAAVEAARAGEQGRGFAVVAAEVRNLAQRSAGAAREITGLIRDSVAKVDAGSALVSESGRTLSEIVTAVQQVTDIMGEIATASGEQSQGIEQVNHAVVRMDDVVQGSAAQTQELSATAQALAAQADELHALVGRFQVRAETVEPEITSAPAPAAAARPARRRPVPKEPSLV